MYQHVGLFSNIKETAIIENLILEQVNIYTLYTNEYHYIGGITGVSSGIIQNCGIESGTITAKNTKAGSSGKWSSNAIGGITGNRYKNF